jgi:hypothetical protein
MAALLSLPAPALAERDSAGEYWGEWELLGSGYVGRRRGAPGMDLTVAERRLQAGTQPRGRGEQPLLVEVSKTSAVSSSKTAAKGKPASAEAVWLRTAAAGLHGVGIDELAVELGAQARDIRKLAERGALALIGGGEPVSWHFDEAADEILFGAEAFSTFFTDWNAYRLEPNGWGARPMPVQGGAPAAAGVEMPFAESLHLEVETVEPFPIFLIDAVKDDADADYWWWDYLYGAWKPTLEVDLEIPDPVAAGPAQLRIVMRGLSAMYAGDDHRVYAVLNGEELQPQGSVLVEGHWVVSWDGQVEKTLVVDIGQDLLNPSGDNTLMLGSVYEVGTLPFQVLDRVEVDYNRRPVAPTSAGMLWLRQVSAGVQTVTNFAAGDIMVIESPAGDAVLREDVHVEDAGDGTWTVTFETVAGTDYLVTERGRVQAPLLAVDQPSKLASRSNRADYLIIASREFQGTAEELATFRRERFSNVQIAWWDDIYQEFSFGREDPFAITRFMETVVGSWRTSPLFVILVGNASLDHKDRMGYGESYLPTVLTSTPWKLSPSDDRLLAGEGAAPFAFGRLPILTDENGVAYVDKLRCYEDPVRWGCPEPGDERLTALLVADDPDEGGNFHANTDALAKRLADELGFSRVDGLYHDSTAMKKVYYDDGTMDQLAIGSVRNELIQTAAWNTGYVSYDGHGTKWQLGDYYENYLSESDAAWLQNTTFPVFAALTCDVGDYTQFATRSLAGELVLNPIGGGIAAMAPTGFSWDIEAQILGAEFVRSLFMDNNTIGGAVREAKAHADGKVSPFMLKIYTVIGDPAVYARD